MIQVTTGEIAETSAGRVTSKCVEEGFSFPGTCILGSVGMADFAALRRAGNRTQELERESSQPSPIVRLPELIVDRTGISDKQRRRKAFRGETPPALLISKQALMANAFIQVGNCQEELQEVRTQFISELQMIVTHGLD